MLVYQLRLVELGEYLEPVFKSRESADKFKEKYKTRNIVIKEQFIENIEDDTVYRIKSEDSSGYFLEDEIFSNIEEATSALKNKHQSIIESRLH